MNKNILGIGRAILGGTPIHPKKKIGFFKGLATLRYIHYNGISINIALHCIALHSHAIIIHVISSVPHQIT